MSVPAEIYDRMVTIKLWKKKRTIRMLPVEIKSGVLTLRKSQCPSVNIKRRIFHVIPLCINQISFSKITWINLALREYLK